MAKFLNTTGINYHLEELIKHAGDRLILISPYLKLTERLRELLEDKNRLKIDIRVIYGKNDLQPEEMTWLKTLEFVRLSFCKNLHAKCYLNESSVIVTSMNLYEFSQINNNEMGILIRRDSDSELYRETYAEAQRLIRISEEIKITVERIHNVEQPAATVAAPEPTTDDAKDANGKLISTSQLAKSLGKSPKDLFARFLAVGWATHDGETWHLTAKGKEQGGQVRQSKQYGDYIVWPAALKIP